MAQLIENLRVKTIVKKYSLSDEDIINSAASLNMVITVSQLGNLKTTEKIVFDTYYEGKMYLTFNGQNFTTKFNNHSLGRIIIEN